MWIAICPSPSVMPKSERFRLSYFKRWNSSRATSKTIFISSFRPSGALAEIASALWQKGIKIQAFSAELHEGQGTFHLVVDKVAVAKKTFVENGWEAAEEDVHQHRNRKIFGLH